MKTIAIIPARGGSKRIPRKNIKDFHGKPIIYYSLQASQDSKIFDCIHVSTEDENIFEVVSKLGFKPEFYRNQETALDHTPIRDVLVEVIKKFDALGKQFDIICLLTATAPLIEAQDLQNAYQNFIDSNKEYPMLAVAKYPTPIEWALTYEPEKNFLIPQNAELFFKSSQDFKPCYYDVGSFAFFTRGQLLNPVSEIKFIPYILPSIKGIDIDNLEDWQAAEILYKNHFKNKL